MRKRRAIISWGFWSIALYGVASTVVMLCQDMRAPAAPSTLFATNTTPPLNDPRHGDKRRNEYVFIGIKTSEAGVHGERLPQLRKTWLKDALDTDEVEVKFFTHVEVNHTGGDDSFLMVTTKCDRKDLPCKTGQVFAHYLNHSNATWFCSFDDDNFVLVHNLIQVLREYENGPSKGRNLYIGRAMSDTGMKFSRYGIFVRFGTGGAGYCLSRDLVERGKDYFSSLENVHLPDDVSVGYVVQHKLGVNITSNKLFHSHIEGRIRQTISQEEIAKQVSFGHSNKRGRSDFMDDMPNTPTLFPREEDPLGFRSLWCYLHESEKDSADCKPSIS